MVNVPTADVYILEEAAYAPKRVIPILQLIYKICNPNITT